MPTIRLATDDDTRAIDSRSLPAILDLAHLYIPTAHREVMRSWGVARGTGDGSLAVYERLYPGGLVAPRFMGGYVDRGELLYYGAEPAADFLPSLG